MRRRGTAHCARTSFRRVHTGSVNGHECATTYPARNVVRERPDCGAVFVMPRRTNEWASAKGVWIAAAGWANAARRRYGHAWVATPEGVFDPDEILRRTAHVALPERSTLTRRSPETAKTFVKDV